MESAALKPGDKIDMFVKNILVFEEREDVAQTILPFFADGYPGLLFHITPKGLRVQPHNKQMPVTFLYGQTLNPIELHLRGNYKIIIFQLYPFVLNSFFGVDIKTLNDDCFDLQQTPAWHGHEQELLATQNTGAQLQIITEFLFQLFEAQKQKIDYKIKEALQFILEKRAQVSVKEVCEQLHLTPRTLERRFIKEVGISTRDFIQITKFQQSLTQLSVRDFNKLTDIVYANGFADQSHFIRVFKAFTGKTPSSFIRQ